MCFSATASFSSGTVLAVVGVISIIKSKNTPQRILAGIPFIFSMQQIVEGVLWLSLLHPTWHRWQGMATYLFQAFAQVVWPVYIPFAILFFEQVQARRRIISFLLLCGVVLALYTSYSLYHYPVLAFAENDHIRYSAGFPLAQKWYYGLLYFVPTIIAPVFSSERYLRWLGYLFLLSYGATRLLFHYYEISVWCFFGAIISFLVVFVISKSLRLQAAR